VNNKYRFILPTNNLTIDIPIEIKWDFYGRTDSIELYEDEVIEELVGLPKDYEIVRFSHEEYGQSGDTLLNYEFNFFDVNSTDIPNSLITDWKNSYLPIGFTVEELYYRSNPVSKSFFKIDFYDTTGTTIQKNYFTIILPTDSEIKESAVLNSILGTTVEFDIPNFDLDFIKNKEGFFIYWLRDRNILDITEFYMTVKFFDAKNGNFIKMMTTAQSELTGIKFLFQQEMFFYYKVILNYSNFTYSIYDVLSGSRVGNGTPLKWYEYINPPQV
jgi:hypothetical protein